jgi:hypothetical protein
MLVGNRSQVKKGIPMKSLSWKESVEVVGILAIVASLVFVGIETRNSTEQAILTNRALEIAAYQELMDNIADINRVQLQDAEVAALIYKSRFSSEELTDLENYRMNRVHFLRFRHGDMAYFQYERGAIDDTRLKSSLKILSLSEPAVRAFWKRNRDNFVESYRHHIDGLVAEYEAAESSP